MPLARSLTGRSRRPHQRVNTEDISLPIELIASTNQAAYTSPSITHLKALGWRPQIVDPVLIISLPPSPTTPVLSPSIFDELPGLTDQSSIGSQSGSSNGTSVVSSSASSTGSSPRVSGTYFPRVPSNESLLDALTKCKGAGYKLVQDPSNLVSRFSSHLSKTSVSSQPSASSASSSQYSLPEHVPKPLSTPPKPVQRPAVPTPTPSITPIEDLPAVILKAPVPPKRTSSMRAIRHPTLDELTAAPPVPAIPTDLRVSQRPALPPRAPAHSLSEHERRARCRSLNSATFRPNFRKTVSEPNVPLMPPMPALTSDEPKRNAGKVITGRASATSDRAPHRPLSLLSTISQATLQSCYDAPVPDCRPEARAVAADFKTVVQHLQTEADSAYIGKMGLASCKAMEYVDLI